MLIFDFCLYKNKYLFKITCEFLKLINIEKNEQSEKIIDKTIKL